MYDKRGKLGAELVQIQFSEYVERNTQYGAGSHRLFEFNFNVKRRLSILKVF